MPIAWFFPLLFTLSTLCSQASWADSVAPAPSATPVHGVGEAGVKPSSPAATFDAGLAAFQKGDLNQARSIFQSLLKADPDRVAVLYNLGLTEQKSGHLGLALALWRKAQYRDPNFAPAARAIAFATPKLEHPEISHEVVFWESWRAALLINHSLWEDLAICALLLLLAGFSLLRFLGKRRRSLLDDKPLPGLPLFAIFVSVVFVASLTLAISKILDESEVRGTIVAKSVSAKSAPDENGTPLFDLYEGLEVIVRQSTPQWVQVEYPGGSTGWIPRAALSTNQATTQDTTQDKAAT